MLHTAGSSTGHQLILTLSFHLCIWPSFRRVLFVDISTKLSCHCLWLTDSFSSLGVFNQSFVTYAHIMFVALSTLVYVCLHFRVSSPNVSNRILFLACQFSLRATLRGKTTGDEISSHAIRVVRETLKAILGHLIRVAMDMIYVITTAVPAMFVTLVCIQERSVLHTRTWKKLQHSCFGCEPSEGLLFLFHCVLFFFVHCGFYFVCLFVLLFLGGLHSISHVQ